MRARTIAEYMAMKERAAQAEQRMKALREKVLSQLETTFHMGGFMVTEFPLLPGGVTLQDGNGRIMTFYWDIMTGSVMGC